MPLVTPLYSIAVITNTAQETLKSMTNPSVCVSVSVMFCIKQLTIHSGDVNDHKAVRIDSIPPSTTEIFFVPLSATQAQSMIDPLPCWTVRRVLSFKWKSVQTKEYQKKRPDFLLNWNKPWWRLYNNYGHTLRDRFLLTLFCFSHYISVVFPSSVDLYKDCVPEYF